MGGTSNDLKKFCVPVKPLFMGLWYSTLSNNAKGYLTLRSKVKKNKTTISSQPYYIRFLPEPASAEA